MLPQPHTLQVKRRTAAATDSTEATYAAPAAWSVYGLAPGALEEPGQANRDLSVVEWSVLAPKTDDIPTEFDRVVVDGKDFEVNGSPADWTRGPWPHPTAGVVVELRRADG